MIVVARLALLVVALLHVGFFVLEAILWTHPIGRAVFDTTAEFARESAVLALNQGVYNLLLAAGLAWSALRSHWDAASFASGCVVVAGIVGALTASPTIMLVQAAPGLVAFFLVRAASGRG